MTATIAPHQSENRQSSLSLWPSWIYYPIEPWIGKEDADAGINKRVSLGSRFHPELVLAVLRSLDGIKNERERNITQGVIEELSEWISDYGSESQSIVPQIERSEVGLTAPVERIILSLSRKLSSMKFWESIPTESALKIGEYAVVHLQRSLVYLSKWSFYMDDISTCDLLGILSEDLERMRTENRVISVNMFDKTWYPTWQFDVDRKAAISVIPNIIRYFRENVSDSCDDIFEWAFSKSRILSGKAPIHVIDSNTKLTDLTDSIIAYQPNKKSSEYDIDKIVSLLPANKYELHESTRLDSLEALEKHKNWASTDSVISGYLRNIIGNTPALIILHHFLKLMRKSPYEEAITEPSARLLGKYIARNTVCSYFQLMSFAHGIHTSLSISELEEDAAIWLGEQAGSYINRKTRLTKLVGAKYMIGDVAKLMDESYEKIQELTQSRELLCIEGYDGPWYPKWQFDLSSGIVRPQAKVIMSAMKSKEGYFVPNLTILSWSNKPNKYLEDQTPSDWIQSNNNLDRLITAAKDLAYLYFYH